jgi:hypothetical protein
VLRRIFGFQREIRTGAMRTFIIIMEALSAELNYISTLNNYAIYHYIL